MSCRSSRSGPGYHELAVVPASDRIGKMIPTEKISTESGIVLFIQKRLWEDAVELVIRSEGGKERFILHWGLRREAGGEWHVPPKGNWPSGSHPFDHAALQTPFEGEITVRIDLAFLSGFKFLDFVLFFPAEGSWDNNLGKNYRIEIPSPPAPPEPSSSGPGETKIQPANIESLAGEIISKEMGKGSWTLMHRFNLCYDQLGKVAEGDVEGLALLYVWLRFSALRQLDWQRNYNTKPLELGHALDRLSTRLAERYRGAPQERTMIRLMLGTLGRGSDAQRVRDEVLAIMHRHQIKEVAGHFMEEWHQKLHNNTTPDDMVICEAYLDFLRSDGDLDVFYRRLKEGGVTKARLESFERPIKSRPDFIPGLKDALIHDFENFLAILNAVHSGTDLDAAYDGAKYLLGPELAGLVDSVRQEGKKGRAREKVNDLAGRIIEARRGLAGLLFLRENKKPGETRNLLFLDMALADRLRVIVERNLETGLSLEEAAGLVSSTLENVCLSEGREEFDRCLKFWKRLEEMPPLKKPWALRAVADCERTGRAIGDFASGLNALLVPKAGRLGEAFHAEPWTIELFSEEVLRGSPAFALSAVISRLEPALRKIAGIGDWQVVSLGHLKTKTKTKTKKASGRVTIVKKLHEIVGRGILSGEGPAGEAQIIITDEIHGDEEIPSGVAAIITSRPVDRLSHLAIRARNAGIFFAACLDPEQMERIKAAAGREMALGVEASGQVSMEETGIGKGVFDFEGQGQAAPEKRKKIVRLSGTALAAVKPSEYAITFADFSEGNVGYKSINLRRLMGLLPDWISLPASMAIPFGVFEKTLGLKENGEIERRLRELEGGLDGGNFEKTLEEMRAAVLRLKAPSGLKDSIRQTAAHLGISFPEDFEGAWTSIKRVWASKWNERACLSRKANGMPHSDLFMSVLIQEAVEADFGFVIHTANPFTLDKEEIYAEAVFGLGETLAGNFPGLALSFTFRKKGARRARIVSMPSKSAGHIAQKHALIFRSDSNGEDLAGYAGAGLYDSFMLPPPVETVLDYSGSRLVWDEAFLMDFTSEMAKLGMAVEKAVGKGAQDIEGAYSKGRFYVVQARPEVL